MPALPPYMESLLIQEAKPLLIGIGIVVLLNLWNLFQMMWNARSSRDEKFEKVIEGLKESTIKLSFEVEHLQKDVNNIGQVVREFRNEYRNGRENT